MNALTLARPVARFLLPILIAVAFGPLIAGLAASLFAIGTNMFAQSGLALSEVFRTIPFSIVLAYNFGNIVIALLGGLLVSMWMLWRPPNFIVVVAAAAIATGIYLGFGAFGRFGPMAFGNVRYSLFTLASAVIAAAGCWLLVVIFRRRHERRAVRAFFIAIFFAMAGPIAGLAGFLTVIIGLSVIGLLTGTGRAAPEKLFNVLYIAIGGVPLAYFYGFIPAAAAGIVIGLIYLCMTRVPWYLALLVGLCVGVVFSIFNRYDAIFGWRGAFGTWFDHLLSIGPSVAATLICWAVVRTWDARQRAAGELTTHGVQAK